MTQPDYEIFDLGRVELQSGEALIDAKLAYKTYGMLNAKGDNVVVLPTFYTGSHRRNEGFFGPGRAIDPARHFVVSVNLFGNGISTSPSNASPSQQGPKFPGITLFDNVYSQHRLLTERLGVKRIALVAGWSMAGCQAYQWAAQYPDMVGAIVPFCASAKTSPHNFVFLEGVKAALLADGSWNMASLRITSQMERNPRAPSLNSIALSTMYSIASSSMVKSMFSTLNSFLYCFTNAFLGVIRMAFSVSLSRELR